MLGLHEVFGSNGTVSFDAPLVEAAPRGVWQGGGGSGGRGSASEVAPPCVVGQS